MTACGQASQRSVKVGQRSFAELFSGATEALSLDSYQRPYVWGREKVEQLLEDLRDHQSKPESPDYYMGTILLHAAAGEGAAQARMFVIDGQQRLTALCILHYLLTGGLPANCELSYRNPLSIKNIRLARDLMQQPQLSAAIFDRICFTVITVDSEDLAFTFFDTQNNRGVPLNATDLLKAFHLRAIAKADHAIALEKACAGRWERMQKMPAVLGGHSDFAPALFGLLLWRARCWTGNVADGRRLEDLRDLLIDEFQTRSIAMPSADTVPLYASMSNRRATALKLLPHDEYYLESASIRLGGRAVDLPFAIRQPLPRGVGFFLYADKYAEVATAMLREDQGDPQMRAFKMFHDEVVAGGSDYLRQAFLLASLMYLDQFGPDQLLMFALRLEHLLGAIRVEWQSVKAETAVNFFKREPRNLLDVIGGAFRPEEVIKYLQERAKSHADQAFDDNSDHEGGVRGRYQQRVLRYFDRTGTLAGKRTWITDAFVRGKVGAS